MDTTESGWTPPTWQLVTPFGTYDYHKRPWWLVRAIWWCYGWRWRRNPALTVGTHPPRR